MKIQLMKDWRYDKASKSLRNKHDDLSIYTGYVGVGRVANYGKPSFYEKLSKVHGPKKAKRIQQSSINRGNAIHKQIQTIKKPVVPGIGVPTYQEVLVIGELLADCRWVQGSLDDLYMDENGDYHLVEYKTKSSRYKWKKWRSDNIEPMFMQIAAYERLLQVMYGIRVKSCTLCVIFPQKDEEPEITTLSRGTLDHYYNQFLVNLRNFN